MSSRLEQKEDLQDKFDYEIIFHKLDMNFAPKNSVLSLTFKRGTTQQESKKKFILDDQTKSAIISEQFSFKSLLAPNEQRNQYKEKFVDVLVNQWKGDKSNVVGGLRINLADYPNNHVYARYEQDVPLEKCNDSTAKMSYQIKCQKTNSRESSEKRTQNKNYASQQPIQGQMTYNQQSGGVGNNLQQQQSQSYKSFAYKRHQELSPVQPKIQQEENQMNTSIPYNEGNSQNKFNYDESSIQQEIVQTNATTKPGNTKKQPIITIGSKKSDNKGFILINQKKKPTTASQNNGINNYNKPTSQLSNSNISETTHPNSEVKERTSKQSSIHSQATNSKSKHLSYQSQSKSPDNSSKLTKNNLLTPRTKTPTPTPRPISNIPQVSASSSTKNATKKEFGYRERSVEQQEQKSQYSYKTEKIDHQQKQQVPKQHKFIIEGKKLEQERQNIKDIKNGELAEKLSSLTKKIRTESQDPRQKDRDDSSNQSYEKNVEGYKNIYQKQQELQDFKKKQIKEISNIDNMINELKTETQFDDFESINGSERGDFQDQKDNQNYEKQQYHKDNNGEVIDEMYFENNNTQHQRQEQQYQNSNGQKTNHHKGKTQFDEDDDQYQEEIQRANHLIPEPQDLQIERKFTFNNQRQSEQPHRQEEKEKEKEWEQKVNALQIESVNKNHAIQQLTVQNQILTSELSSVQQQLQYSDQEKQSLNSLNQILRKQNDELEVQISATQQRYSLKLSQLQEVANTPTATPKNGNQSAENTQYMIDQIKIISNQNKELQKENKQQQNTLFEYQTNLSEQQKTIEELTFKINQKDISIQDRQRDIEILRNQVHENKRSSVQIQDQQVDDVKRIYESQIQNLLEQLKRSNDEKQTILIQFQVRQQQYEDQIIDLNNQIEDANHKIESFDQYYQLYENSGKAVRELENAHQQIKQMETNEQILYEEKRNLEEQVDRLEQQMNKSNIQQTQSSHRMIDIIQTERDNAIHENKLLQNKIELLQNQLKNNNSLNIPISSIKSDDYEELYFQCQNKLRQTQNKLELIELDVQRQKEEHTKTQNILTLYQNKSAQMEFNNKDLENQLYLTKSDLCIAMNGILGSSSHEVYDNIEDYFSFKEIYTKIVQ